MHTKPMAESDGTFTNENEVKWPCPKCGGKVHMRVWESSCGGYEDEKYTCTACPWVRWAEGPDS